MEQSVKNKLKKFLLRKGLLNEEDEDIEEIIDSFNRNFEIFDKERESRSKAKTTNNNYKKEEKKKVEKLDYDLEEEEEEEDEEDEEEEEEDEEEEETRVNLRDRQKEHFSKMMEILDNNFFALDLSSMGLGKTHIISKIAQERNFNNMVVICPKSVIPTWEKTKKSYNLPIAQLDNNIEGIMSYESFRGTKEGVTKNGLLEMEIIKETLKTGKIKKTTTFRSTKKLDKLIKSGCLFAFDEFQKSKNATTSTHIASKALILRVKHYFDKGYDSRVVLATGTIIDTEVQATGFMSLVGIQNEEKLYTNVRGNFKTEDLGYDEIVEYSEDLNPELTVLAIEEGLTPIPDGPPKSSVKSARKTGKNTQLGNRQTLNSKNIKNVVFSIFHNVIEKYVSSAMPPPEYEVPIDVKNGYYKLSKERKKILKDEIENLQDAVSYNKNTGSIFGQTNKSKGMGVVTTTLRNIEITKLEIFIRLAITYLEKNSHNKVPLIFNYLTSIKIANRILEKYSPLILYGQVSQSDRDIIIERFNRPNSKYRLYIGQLRASSSGIELDDKNGSYPRFPLISPNYSAIDTHQVTYRFFRDGTKSTPEIRYVYAAGGNLEESILNAYQKKSNVFKKTLKVQSDNGMKFPGDYDQYEEDNIDFPKFNFQGFNIVINEKDVINNNYKTLSTLINEIYDEVEEINYEVEEEEYEEE